MARKRAAIKYIRKSRKNRAKNIAVKAGIKKAMKEAIAAITKKGKDSKEKVKAAASVIDKAVENGVLHKNTGARRKARLMRALNRASKK